MKTHAVRFALVLAAILIALGCPNPTTQTSATTKLSDAFFDVPASLAGSGAARSLARTAASDALVKTTVESYYAMVRDQVKFGADVATSLKSLVADLEAIKIGNDFLLDATTNITHTATDGKKYRWTTVAAGSYFLEIWAANGTKNVELRFTKNNSHYTGTVTASPAGLGWAEPAVTNVKNPDWVKAEFDTDVDGLGTGKLTISVQGFRYHPDLYPAVENAVIILTKDSAGTVKLGSIVLGAGSRHFIWNGYIKNAANQETLNTSVTPETRYYTAAGVADVTDKATVYLGIPTAVGDTVFTANGIGALVKQLFADRLNNDYDFDGSQDTESDQGHEIIAILNLYSGVTPLLDTTTYGNTADAVFTALQGTQANIPTPNDTVDFLVSMMSVTNPAYFDSTTYQSYGASTPTGWPALSDAEARALLPAQSSVDAMAIAFEDGSAAGF